MRKIQLICIALAIGFVIGMSDTAEAQRPGHFFPARPTFSSYLLYRQVNNTGIPNYYSYVRPANQNRTLRPATINSTSRRQALSIEDEVAKVLESQLRQRVTTGIGQPSVAAQFGDTSHFYPRTQITR